MRILTVVPALLLACVVLGGCTKAAAPGVLPRDPVPPPPDMRSNDSKRSATTGSVSTPAARRAISIPERLETPRPSL
jgi:hypothetical protein